MLMSGTPITVAVTLHLKSGHVKSGHESLFQDMDLLP